MNRIKAQRDTIDGDGAHLSSTSGSKPENPIYIGRKNEDGKPVIDLEKEAFPINVAQLDMAYNEKVVKLSTAQDREEELKKEIQELKEQVGTAVLELHSINGRVSLGYSPSGSIHQVIERLSEISNKN